MDHYCEDCYDNTIVILDRISAEWLNYEQWMNCDEYHTASVCPLSLKTL